MVIELFTSQGCSSCPPAEEWVGQLRRHPSFMKDLIPIVWHVDYWDQLGWKDTLAAPEFTARQSKYSRQWNSSQVYTPGLVVDGKELRNWRGFTPEPGAEAKKLDIKISGKTLSVMFPNSPSQTLWMAVVSDGPAVPVKHGENAGRKLLQDFVVKKLEKGLAEKGLYQWDLNGMSGHAVVWVEEGNDPTPRYASAIKITE